MEPEHSIVIAADAGDPRAARRILLDGHELAAIFLGGAAGGLTRAALVQSLPARPGTWPWATFILNIGAAALLGLVVTHVRAHPPRRRYRAALLGTGVCGALSTFSTMMLEILRMIDAGRWGLALGYAVASIAAGLAAVSLAKLLRRSRRTL